ncbi:VOC family protein [Pokkaliibacter sp. CJK22405]|uniref:VOC family protein n=1 Tax=Pokkaliibacter sp. CJK22405 TaxID=3384615 RepID=UPI0039852F78
MSTAATTNSPERKGNRGIKGIEHIGITVPNHEQAVAFFEQAFGATPLFSLVTKNDPPMTFEDVGPKNGLRPGTAMVAVTMMRLANGANVELFEIDYPGKKESIGISDIGISHFSLNVQDINTATDAFVKAGGQLLEGPYELGGQEEGEGNMGCFGLTPWGLLVEFERFDSPLQYDEGATETRWFPSA